MLIFAHFKENIDIKLNIPKKNPAKGTIKDA